MFMNVAGVGLFTVLTIIPHELGHVFAARALGWRVHQVVIGVGKPLFKRRVWGILFDIRTLPVAGGTLLVPNDMRAYRLKKFLVILAGPAVNAGLIAGLLLILNATVRNLDFDSLPNWAGLFIIANVFVLIVNLWPHQPKSGFDMATDGKQLLQLVSFSEKARRQILAQRFALEARMWQENGELGRARELCDEGLASVPEDVPLLNMSGILCLDEARYKQAREIFLKLAQNENQSPATKFLFLNNLAYVDVLMENVDLLQEADSYSRDAYAALPWMPAVVGTRGTVLAAMGKHEEGLGLLRKSMEMRIRQNQRRRTRVILYQRWPGWGKKPRRKNIFSWLGSLMGNVRC
jgi:tetratricopeptide (TPR) repeat protein